MLFLYLLGQQIEVILLPRHRGALGFCGWEVCAIAFQEGRNHSCREVCLANVGHVSSRKPDGWWGLLAVAHTRLFSFIP